MDDPKDLLRIACETKDHQGAVVAVQKTLESSPKSSQIYNTYKHIQALAESLGLATAKLSILSSFTSELLTPNIYLQQFQLGTRIDIQYVQYDQWYLALHNPSQIDDFDPDFVLLLLHLDDVAPKIAYTHLTDWEGVEEERDWLTRAIKIAIENFQARSNAAIILGTFISHQTGVERYFDRNVMRSKFAAIEEYNRDLTEIASSSQNVYIFDYANIVQDYGRKLWFDPVKNFSSKSSVTIKAIPTLATEISSFISALQNPRKKVLAVDFDNTIWGGIIGEDGLDGISIGGNYPGNAFGAFQSFLKNLSASGILLVAASKNNPDDAREVFETYRSMPLKWDDFASHQINWDFKYKNLLRAADELNVGVDSFVFVDDNPVEIEMMRKFLPEVHSILLDGSPATFPKTIVATGVFDSVSLTEEDLYRKKSYQAEKKRTEHKSNSGNIDQFLSELELQVTVDRTKKQNIERITQLLSKTNQFNMTTKRYSFKDIIGFLQNDKYDLLSFYLKDKFGDYGLISIVILISEKNTTEIDSFLMSCRALGRNVETAILAIIDQVARDKSSKEIIGYYVPTKKNGLASEFYAKNGFEYSNEHGEFVQNLHGKSPLEMPSHVHVINLEE